MSNKDNPKNIQTIIADRQTLLQKKTNKTNPGHSGRLTWRYAHIMQAHQIDSDAKWVGDLTAYLGNLNMFCFVCLSVCLSAGLSVCLSVCLFVCFSSFLFVLRP